MRFFDSKAIMSSKGALSTHKSYLTRKVHFRRYICLTKWALVLTKLQLQCFHSKVGRWFRAQNTVAGRLDRRLECDFKVCEPSCDQRRSSAKISFCEHLHGKNMKLGVKLWEFSCIRATELLQSPFYWLWSCRCECYWDYSSLSSVKQSSSILFR